ncbi:MAG: hypothetical protein V1901_03955 [Patescibacteria group bacterium]
MAWKIISYYTENYKSIYEKYLKSSLDILGLIYYVSELPNFKSWKAATDFKPVFIQQCLGMFIEDLIWIDCDAKINFYPSLFDNIGKEYDLGVHYFDPRLFYNYSINPPHVASGTVFIRNTLKIIPLIEDWIKNTSTVKWEQMALEKAIINNPNIKVLNLPRIYCYITSQPSGDLPKVIEESPCVSHFQASRIMRNKNEKMSYM